MADVGHLLSQSGFQPPMSWALPERHRLDPGNWTGVRALAAVIVRSTGARALEPLPYRRTNWSHVSSAHGCIPMVARPLAHAVEIGGIPRQARADGRNG